MLVLLSAGIKSQLAELRGQHELVCGLKTGVFHLKLMTIRDVSMTPVGESCMAKLPHHQLPLTSQRKT